MKYLILTFLAFGILACRDSKNIVHTKNKTEQALTKANVAYEKELEMALHDLTLKAKKEINSKKAKVAVKRASLTYQKCKEIMKKLGKTNNLKSSIRIQEEYTNWLNLKAKEWDLGVKFPQVEDSIWKNRISKELRKQELYNHTALVLAKLGATDLAGGTHCGFGVPIIFLSNLNRVESGKNIELSLFLRNYNRHYYADAKTNQGIIKNGSNTGFELRIPSKKLGKQSFEVAVRARNFIEDIDTTLYVQGTFEVIP